MVFSGLQAAMKAASRDDPRAFPLSAGRGEVLSDRVKRQALDGEGAAGYSQMEANFSLFFGLAVQLYQATLVSDDTPFDRFVEGDATALTDRQQRGMNRFLSGNTSCGNCHAGSEFTAASVTASRDPQEAGLVEVMAVGDGKLANYDIGFYSVGVRPTHEDLGRGGAVSGHLDLDGPYMRTGGMATLLQVVDFYVRGGDFREANIENPDLDITDINGMKHDPEKRREWWTS